MTRLILLILFACPLVLAQSLAVYPQKLPTDKDLLRATDDTKSTLAVAMTATSDKILLTAASNFVPFQAVTIDNEIIKICTVSTDGRTLEVCKLPSGRGFSKTLPMNHARGVDVRANIVAQHHEALKDNLIAIAQALGANLSNVCTIPQLEALQNQVHRIDPNPPSDPTEPNCTVAWRGKFYVNFGGAGKADTVDVCTKDANGDYAWHTVIGYPKPEN